MTNRKTTKKALLGSLLALVLCFSMLVGTTFAWFTDSEFMNGNKIQAGTLDIELDKETTLFTFYDKWEPGYTAYASNVLKNVGTLALKYKFSIINVVEVDGAYDNKDANVAKPDGSRLAEVLDVYVGKTADDIKDENCLGTLADLMARDDFNIVADYENDTAIQYLKAGESKEINLMIKMREEAGNEYMADSIEFDIAIVATQYTFEEDDVHGDQYDKNALYPAIEPIVANAGETLTVKDVKIDVSDYAEEGDAIVANKGSVVNIESGNFNGGYTPFGGAGNTAVFANGGTVNIYGGYFFNNGLAKDADGNLDKGHIDLIYAKAGGRVNIYGGFFEGADETVWLVNCKDKSQDTGDSRIFIYGGTFVNWNPKDAATGATEILVPSTSEVTKVPQDNGDIWYVVTPKN